MTSSHRRRRRTLCVTGSASGIGAAVCRRFEQAGASVIGVDRSDAAVLGDLADRDGRDAILAEVTARAEGRLDGLVLCAGLGPHVRPVEDIVRVNYFAALVVADGLLPVLREGEAAAAVAIASNAAGITPLHAGLLEALDGGDEAGATALAAALDGATVYGMSKRALVGAVRSRARRWGEAGVRLNAVAPGPVETPLLQGSLADPDLGPAVEALPIPLGRRGSPEEVAAAVAFLLDPANGYIHGSVLFVDGGSDAELRPGAL